MVPLLEDGVLPEGVHDCTADEVAEAFGRFQRSDRRMKLVEKLVAYLADARRSAQVVFILVDGSFVTAKDEPEDIDLLVALKPGVDWDGLRPFEYNAVSKRMIKQLYRFDAFAYEEGTPEYAKIAELFQSVRPDATYTTRRREGILRVRL